MKKQYSKPVATMMNYTYETQVVAESKIAGNHGDPNGFDICTWWSGWVQAGCREKYEVAGICEEDKYGNPFSV